MADCLVAVDELQIYRDKLAQRALETSQGHEAANDLAEATCCAETLRHAHRLIVLEGERFGAERAPIERTICDLLAEGRSEDARRSLEQLAAFDAIRIGSYAAGYEAFYAQYVRELERLQRSIATLTSQLPPLARTIHVLSRPRRSVLDLAKAIVRRVPGGPPLVLAVRRFRKWVLQTGPAPRN
jgi:hypothetical protein